MRRTRAFSLIELVVTLAIIGLLTVSVLPTIGQYSKNNNVLQAAQSLREAFAEVHADAVAPDPTTCPILQGVGAFTYPINNYSIFASSAATTTPPFDPNNLNLKYQCGGSGMTNALQNLNPNQYAILARSIQTLAGVTTEYTVGVVRIGELDAPAQFAVPVVNAASHPWLFGYNSPSGSFSTTSTIGYNYVPSSTSGDKVYAPNNVQLNTTAAADKSFLVVGLTNPNNYQLALFINLATGQVTSTNNPPAGFN